MEKLIESYDDPSYIRKMPVFDEKKALSCLHLRDRWRVVGETVSSGGYGRLFRVCDVTDEKDPSCKKRVVKIMLMAHPRQVDAFTRELAIYDVLRDSGLVPILYSDFTCGIYGYMIMERLAADLGTVVAKQTDSQLFRDKLWAAVHNIRGHQHGKQMTNDDFNQWVERRAQVFVESQLKRIFFIADHLGNDYDVLHGDLKLDQFLLDSDTPFDATARMKITDFGSSGLVGQEPRAFLLWNYATILDKQDGDEKECKLFEPLPPVDADERQQHMYRQWFNIFQLVYLLSYSTMTTFILSDDLKQLSVWPHKYVPPFLPSKVFDTFFQRYTCAPDNVYPFEDNRIAAEYLPTPSLPVYQFSSRPRVVD